MAAISRAQELKELLPGLNALFGDEYAQYESEHSEIYVTESSERSFEEELKLSGFAAAPVKDEGSAIVFDTAQESFVARYTHETIGMGFSITEEAMVCFALTIPPSVFSSGSGIATKIRHPIGIGNWLLSSASALFFSCTLSCIYSFMNFSIQSRTSRSARAKPSITPTIFR